MRKWGLAVLVFALAATAVTPVLSAPRLIGKGGQARLICRQALKIAEKAFYSPVFYLYHARGVPKDLGSDLILRPIEGIDLSGGDAVIADPADFLPVPKPQTHSRIYWQRTAGAERRLVLDGNGLGWRGDRYSLYALPASMMAEAFQANPDAFKPLIEDSWQVPWVLKGKAKGEVWAIDTGDRYFLADWTVFTPASAEPVCTIRFVNKQRDALKLLPPEVRKLAVLLDDALGPGLDEGTLQPTAQLRVRSWQTWANVALRPWALSREPYNSREQVDAALKAWSKTSRRATRLHAGIYRQYPVAREALVQLYVTRFGKTPAKARQMAEASLDIALRGNFVFPRESQPSW